MRDLGRYAVDYVSKLDPGVEFCRRRMPPSSIPLRSKCCTPRRIPSSAPGTRLANTESAIWSRSWRSSPRRSASSFWRATTWDRCTWRPIATLCFVCQPRIFADSFYNPKDIPFLVTYVFGALTLSAVHRAPHRLLDRAACRRMRPVDCHPHWRRVSRRGHPDGRSVARAHDEPRREKGSPLAPRALRWRDRPCHRHLLASSWRSPVRESLNALDFLGEFPFVAPVLFNGEMIEAERLPWYCIPEWIAITTPIVGRRDHRRRRRILGVAGGNSRVDASGIHLRHRDAPAGGSAAGVSRVRTRGGLRRVAHLFFASRCSFSSD